MKSYSDVIKYLDSFVNYERTGFDASCRKFDLSKLRRALDVLGNPEKSFRTVHVTGTKGKGSVCTFISHILKESGHKVGLFTSPHLISPRERIQINNNMISEEDLSLSTGVIKKYIDESKGEKFSFFELYFLIAMIYFKNNGVDFAVLEVGLGGRCDATNVVDSEISVITPISYDHMDVLGEEIEKIAGEKAAIIKKTNKACFTSPQRPSVMEVIERKCKKEGVALKVVGKDILFENVHYMDKETIFDVTGLKETYKNCTISMVGKFQVTNSTLGIGVCEALIDDNGREEAIKKAIYEAFIPGRLELISKSPSILIDGAQNEESAKKLKYSVEHYFKYDRLILLLGVSKDKDIKGICKELVPIADEVVITRAQNERAADPSIIRGFVREKPAHVTGDVKEALGVALTKARKNDLILATGSFFVIGEIRKLILK